MERCFHYACPNPAAVTEVETWDVDGVEGASYCHRCALQLWYYGKQYHLRDSIWKSIAKAPRTQENSANSEAM